MIMTLRTGALQRQQSRKQRQQFPESMSSVCFIVLLLFTVTGFSNASCSVCGDGKEVGKPDAIFECCGIEPKSCGDLQTQGKDGAISPESCGVLPTLINVCECIAIPTESPVQTPTKSPTITPTKTPTKTPPTTKTPTKTPSETVTKSPTKLPVEEEKPSPSPTSTFEPSPSPTNLAVPTIEPMTIAPVTDAPAFPTVSLPLTKRPRCGFNWKDANQNCYGFCRNDADCKDKKKKCFLGMNYACPVLALRRCGTDYTDANRNCRSFCEVDTDCFPQKCFTDVEDICQARCGNTWEEANGQCENQCRTLEKVDCPEGQQCYSETNRICSKFSGVATTKVAMAILTLLVVNLLLLC